MRLVTKDHGDDVDDGGDDKNQPHFDGFNYNDDDILFVYK